MNESPIISVIMPLYNKGKYVAQAINSLLSQTFRHWELVIIYDESTDNSWSVASSFVNDSRIHIVKSDRKAGVSHARNIGIRVSRGRYVSFLDADDVYAPDKLELQLALMKNNSDEAVIYSDYYVIGANESIEPSLFNVFSEGRVLVKFLERSRATWAYPSIFVCRSDLDKIGLFDESLPTSEDYDLILKLARIRPFFAVRIPLYGYRLVSTSLFSTTSKKSKFMTRYDVIKRHISINEIKMNSAIRNEIACCLIAARAHRKLLWQAIRDPRYLSAYFYAVSSRG